MQNFVTTIIFPVLLTALSAGCQMPSAKKNILTIDRDYWEGCETGKGECKALTFYRKSVQDSVMLVMPCGGTGTEVILMKKGSEKRLQDVHITHADCPPKFDLTGYADGDYVANMFACGLGGPVSFSLVTKEK